MNKTIGIIIAIVLIGGGIYFLMNRAPDVSDTGYDTTAQPSQQQSPKTNAGGRVVFSVTDAAANMSTISEINMKVNSVDVHSNDTGWMTVSTTPKTYSLLMLNAKNQSQLLADANIKTGTYDQVRLMVDSISVKTKTGATKEAKLPSGELKINTNLVVNTDTTSSLSFDFMADKSLHTTGNGAYIFAPVVKTEAKSNVDVSVDANSIVTIGSGHVDDTNTEGMDVDGSVKADFQLNSKAKINIDNNNMIKVEGLLK